MHEKTEMILESLRQNIIKNFGTKGFESLESLVKDPVFTSDWEKSTVKDV